MASGSVGAGGGGGGVGQSVKGSSVAQGGVPGNRASPVGTNYYLSVC